MNYKNHEKYYNNVFENIKMSYGYESKMKYKYSRNIPWVHFYHLSGEEYKSPEGLK
jgi:hypothetical protein